jgi:hypothetical protein
MMVEPFARDPRQHTIEKPTPVGSTRRALSFPSQPSHRNEPTPMMRPNRLFLTACAFAAASLSAGAAAAQQGTPATVVTAPADSAATAATPAPAPALAPRRARPRRDLMTREEALASSSHYVYEAIERLHPTWLRVRSTGNMGDPSQEIVVYVDGQTMGGPSFLKTMSVEHIVAVQYFDAIQSAACFGDAAKAGAFLVTTR